MENEEPIPENVANLFLGIAAKGVPCRMEKRPHKEILGVVNVMPFLAAAKEHETDPRPMAGLEIHTINMDTGEDQKPLYLLLAEEALALLITAALVTMRMVPEGQEIASATRPHKE